MHSQATAADKIKATFIFNFTRNFTWPDSEKIETFTIAVLGKKNEGLRVALEENLKTKTFSGRPYVVKLITAITDIKDIQLLYVNGDDRFDQTRIFRRVKGDKILLVAENLLDFNRSMINFIEEDGKFRYSMNQKVIDEEGFTYTESIRQMAVLTETSWKDVYTKYRELLQTDKNKIAVNKEDLETMLNDYEKQNKEIAEQQLLNERSIDEIEKLSYEAQAKELKIKAQNDVIRRNRLEAKNKEQENELLRREKLLKEAESRSQQMIITTVSVALVLIVIFTIFVIRSWYFTRKQKEIIEAQKDRVEQQKEIILLAKQTIEEKNKDITDSITYAQRIQQAKLPLMEKIHSVFPDSFVLFKPKDIVSGDFYFFREKNQCFYMAVADCTGHGVPGAFMSLISMERLEETLQFHSDPPEILNKLNIAIKNSLQQHDGDTSTRDGMDIAICQWNSTTSQLTYSGANRSLWIVRNGQTELDEIKPTKKAIGGFTADDQVFDSHTLRLQKGDVLYLFSDGFADTFNGVNGKKLTTRKFKEILLSLQHKPMSEQMNFLDTYIENWKAGSEQVDDICVFGIRI